MIVIPAIDIIDGKCVRLTQGDYSQKKIYDDNPAEVAKRYEDHGFSHLHVVDLDGARSKHVVNIDVLKNITQSTDLKIDFGGGVKSTRDIEQAFEAGASMITGGSIAVKEPIVFEQWIDQYGPEKIILGADVKNRHIAVAGWMETSEKDIMQFIDHYTKRSIKFVICTDISKDGVLKGSALELYKELLNAFPGINLIASGGVGSLKDVEDLVESGVWGVIVGKAIYEGRVDLDDLIKFQN
jgi:phosphoribosylformimino-5-aminoimidazole carboxamide ribotide isomerase